MTFRLYCKTIFVMLLGVACTSSPKMQDYPERQIHRPYTLLDGMASWEMNVTVTTMSTQPVDDLLAVNPLRWDQALSENWTLEWLPLPLAARYQFLKTNNQIGGIRFGSGLGYSSFAGAIIQPHVSGYYRYIFGDNLAWENQLSFSLTHYAKENHRNSEISTLWTGPMIQIDQTKMFSAKVGLRRVANELKEFSEFRDSQSDDSFHVYVPLNASFKWLFYRQWELSLLYSLNSIAYREGLEIQSLQTGITHYW